MAKGHCNCGAIQFEADGEPDGVFLCHCSICRRHTGTMGNAVVHFAKRHFRWLSGEALISCWSKPGHDWHIWFCSVCGSQLPGENDPENMFVPVGLLSEGHEELKVLHHIFVDSKAPWDEIGDAGKQHREAFEG